ncbi:heparinase II/III-like family protein [Synechococcus sp. BIOS-U3-1]|uniref:heparinase II/III domain-containing protein n=1 Tax=Synechococcus sp. BIOS-U3-1 TaxID=1400865 RepID=UPI001644B35E|nr:heparinase II/III family protein [Synechococcus sp. BIOS-U3-1]QNI57189.1 heparinase II/III-like family protein [Synechococcus sp. BIOS-U3-1]
MQVISQLRIIKRLGWRNCAAVAAHRVALRTGLYVRQLPLMPCPIPERLNGQPHPAPFSADGWSATSLNGCLAAADALLAGTATWFSHESHAVGSPPEWFFDPASGQRFTDGSQHWSCCRPFAGADIKRCWELSRWAWAPLLIRAWRLSGDHRYRDGFNSWCLSWCQANPVNGGSNWVCGQEASMRLLHALQAWQLADAPAQLPDPRPQRAAFVAAHLQRIAATERYAQAQDNNHWISEAAALFIGGSWLEASASAHASEAQRWASEGRRALERSVARLVMADGSFAQHSLTYHRLLLDTLAQVELCRRWLDLPGFSQRFRERCRAATHWFAALVDPCSGDGPNLGSNDGVFVYQLHSQPYRDFRPTLQLASVLFAGQRALEPGPWDEPLHWFELISSSAEGLDASSPQAPKAPSLKPSQAVELFADGGYGLLRPTSRTWALLRLPNYRFRPAHADPLHLDLWHEGVNLLRDGGSYAYNSDAADLAYFPGIASHNSVQFDGAEPMPRLGRFLWGDWLQLVDPPLVESGKACSSITAAYRSPHGRHKRQVQVDPSGLGWIITDHCSSFRHRLLLRWRLCPADWQLLTEGATAQLFSSRAQISLETNFPIQRLEVVEGWESLLYAQKTTLPVLEIEVAASSSPALIITNIALPVPP